MLTHNVVTRKKKRKLTYYPNKMHFSKFGFEELFHPKPKTYCFFQKLTHKIHVLLKTINIKF